MKGIILAAGQGTRLKKYTENLPKGMLEFQGKTVIQRQIELYRRCGVEEIVIVRGFAGDKIRYDGVKYYTNEDFANTNMVESLLAARDEFDSDVIVSYSDVIFDEKMLRGMIAAAGDFSVAVDLDWQEYWQARYGRVDFDTESLALDETDNIISLGLENPPLDQIDARYVGLLKFSRRGLEVIQEIMAEAYRLDADAPWQQSGKPVRKAYMTDLLQAVIEAGEQVHAEEFRHGWIEFDTNEDYETACKWMENGQLERFVSLL